ncbi:hypothetical protein QWY93_18490 [Echinicola jeungdonensis]|nr:hypothetical protein [Echinicola jeungdonensis]MDN3671287.1 hypothetical protein [Echinicola jeungdonensis]
MENLSSRKEAEDTLSKYISEKGIRQFLLKNLEEMKKVNLPGR